MKSESTRLLRQWWDEPGDYQWVVEFYRRRGLIGALRASNVFGGIVTTLALACLLFEKLIQPSWLSHAVVIGMLVSSIGWIVFWCFFPWPPAWQTAVLFAFADIGIAVATAEQIRGAVGPSAFVARTGGEEFVVLDLLNLPNAAPIAESIRAAIEAPDTPKATASVGVAVGSIKDVTAFEAIHAIGDETMYAAKRSGGNRIALAGHVESAESSGKHDEIQLLPTELKERYSLGTESLGL